MKKQAFLQLTLAVGLFAMCFMFQPSHAINHLSTDKDSLTTTENDTIWNVIVYVEFGVDSNGHIHDVAAESQFECMRCDSSLINDLKQEAVETVRAMPHWDNYQHKDIKYEIPVHMVRTHPHHTHRVHRHKDSVRVDID